jgi:hypothetical protein
LWKRLITEIDLINPFLNRVGKAWQKFFSSIRHKLKALHRQLVAAFEKYTETIQADPRLNNGKYFVARASVIAKLKVNDIIHHRDYYESEVRKVRMALRKSFSQHIKDALRNTYEECARQSGQ